MKKLLLFSCFSLLLIPLLSCSQLKRSPKKTPAQETISLTETVELEEALTAAQRPKRGEYTHEMAEATVDDREIKKEVGAMEIDAELPGSESDAVPYSREFLKKKNTKRMQFWVEYFTVKQRERFQRFLNNGEEYRHHIEAILQEYGLPKELYYVGLIESGYYLGARSHASAVGPWQFIRGTGRRYGLRINSDIDERRDLFKSTHSAAQYFKDLHKMFSSWELALAAYNAGENGMLRRIVKYGTRDFYELSRRKKIPSETINYVPKVLAAMHIVKHAEKYGFHLPKKKHGLFDSTVLIPTKKNMSLSKIAKRLGVSTRLLAKLNPELRRRSTPRYFAGTYHLRVPMEKYGYVLQETDTSIARAKIPKLTRPETRRELTRRTANSRKRERPDRPSFHRVRRGETLLSIANKYKISAGKLAVANNFKTWKTRVKVGQRLIIGDAEEQRVSTRMASTPKVKITNRPIVYKVKRGDNLTEIAKLFDTKVSKLKRANKLKRARVLIGQKLVVPGTQKAIYTVRRGDHLTKVAKDFNLPLETLIKINSLKKKTIYPGQKIIVNMD